MMEMMLKVARTEMVENIIPNYVPVAVDVLAVIGIALLALVALKVGCKVLGVATEEMM